MRSSPTIAAPKSSCLSGTGRSAFSRPSSMDSMPSLSMRGALETFCFMSSWRMVTVTAPARPPSNAELIFIAKFKGMQRNTMPNR